MNSLKDRAESHLLIIMYKCSRLTDYLNNDPRPTRAFNDMTGDISLIRHATLDCLQIDRKISELATEDIAFSYNRKATLRPPPPPQEATFTPECDIRRWPFNFNYFNPNEEYKPFTLHVWQILKNSFFCFF